MWSKRTIKKSNICMWGFHDRKLTTTCTRHILSKFAVHKGGCYISCGHQRLSYWSHRSPSDKVSQGSKQTISIWSTIVYSFRGQHYCVCCFVNTKYMQLVISPSAYELVKAFFWCFSLSLKIPYKIFQNLSWSLFTIPSVEWIIIPDYIMSPGAPFTNMD